MLKRNDWLLVLMLAAAAAALFCIAGSMNKGKQAAGTVRIRVNGQIYQDVPMENEKEILIRQENGAENILRVTEHGFRMLSSTCENQSCVHQGEVTRDNYAARALGTHILCLPNRVDAELLLSPADIDPNAPDA